MGLWVQMPTAGEVEEVAKTIAAVGGVAAAIWAGVHRIWRVVRKTRQTWQLYGKAIRYLLDAQRHTLHFVTPTTQSRFVSVDEMQRQKTLIDGMRDEVWVADGHTSERERERVTEDVVAVLSRTQAIQAKEKRDSGKEVPMFADEEEK